MRTEIAALFNSCGLYLINYARRMAALKLESRYQKLAWKHILMCAFAIGQLLIIVFFERVIYHKYAMSFGVTALT
jgi:hypothetical protein